VTPILLALTWLSAVGGNGNAYDSKVNQVTRDLDLKNKKKEPHQVLGLELD
jgi:hypothetical protein